MNDRELTYAEFCAVPMKHVLGISGAWGSQRAYRNDDLGIQKEVITKRKTYDDIYSGWCDPRVAYFLDGDSREFVSGAELYVAWMARVCGVEVGDE